MKKNETLIQEDIVAYLNSRKILNWRVSGASNLSGFPDLLACYRGVFVAYEIKTPVGAPTMQQLKVIHDITSAGGAASIVTCIEDVVMNLAHLDSYVDHFD